jgi:hypothetical protein
MYAAYFAQETLKDSHQTGEKTVQAKHDVVDQNGNDTVRMQSPVTILGE